MKKLTSILSLLIITLGLQSQTLIKPKQIAGDVAGSILTTTGTGVPTWTNSIPSAAIPTLSAYVPYTGATTSVNLGANSLSVGAVSTLSQVVTNTISSNGNDSLLFFTNNSQRFKINNDGTFRLSSTTTTNSASGGLWYNFTTGTGTAAPTGFNFYNPTNTFWERIATFRNQYTGLQIQLSNSSSTMAGWLKPMRNQGVGIQDSAGTTGLRVDNGGKVVITPASTGTHTANFTVLGTMSVSSSASVLGTFNASDIRSYGGNHLNLNSPAANVLIGTGGNVYAAINASGMNIGNSSAPGGATLRVIGTFSSSSTNTLTGATRIGSSTAPSATLDVTGTMSVSGQSTLTGVQTTTLMATSTSTFMGQLNIDGGSITLTGNRYIGSSNNDFSIRSNNSARLLLKSAGDAQTDVSWHFGSFTTPNASAQIEVTSTTKGVLFPRMTTAQKNAITGVAGLVVYDTTLNKLCVYTGAAWETITSL